MHIWRFLMREVVDFRDASAYKKTPTPAWELMRPPWEMVVGTWAMPAACSRGDRMRGAPPRLAPCRSALACEATRFWRVWWEWVRASRGCVVSRPAKNFEDKKRIRGNFSETYFPWQLSDQLIVLGLSLADRCLWLGERKWGFAVKNSWQSPNLDAGEVPWWL